MSSLLIPPNKSDIPLQPNFRDRLPQIPTLDIPAENHDPSLSLQTYSDQVPSFIDAEVARKDTARRPELRESQRTILIELESGERVRWYSCSVRRSRI